MKSDRSGQVQYACLPWRRRGDRLEVMLITSRGTGRWILPKGWPMIGASGVESAVQEALEEAGVRGQASGAIGRYPYDKVLKDRSVRRLEVEVYPLAVSEELADWKREAPQAELVSAAQARHASDALAAAQRRAGDGEDVILLVDSLTRFAESFGDTETAKELFDAGRGDAAKGKGSLTVVVALERS